MLMGFHGDAPGEAVGAAAALPQGRLGQAAGPRPPPPGRVPESTAGRRGCGQATPRVSLFGELPPLSPTVARRSPRPGGVILARCSFFRRNTLTVSSSVRHKSFSSQKNQRASNASSRNFQSSLLL